MFSTPADRLEFLQEEATNQDLLEAWGIEESDMADEEITFEEMRSSLVEEAKEELEQAMEASDLSDMISFHRGI